MGVGTAVVVVAEVVWAGGENGGRVVAENFAITAGAAGVGIDGISRSRMVAGQSRRLPSQARRRG